MSGKILLPIVSSLMVLSLVMTACKQPAAPTPPAAPSAPTTPAAPAAPTAPTTPAAQKPQQEPAKPAAEVPKYGGTLKLVLSADVTTFDGMTPNAGQTTTGALTNQKTWSGDWTKGPAGGFGTKETTWLNSGTDDIFTHKAGYIAESWKWTTDEAKNEGTLVYQIRQGIHWSLNPASEASRLVNGRELTADDVIFNLKRVITDPRAFIYLTQPELRTANITKTGPWEVTIKTPIQALIVAISRFGDSMPIYPPEVVNKYGDMTNWRNSVGTGSFILTDYVPGSAVVLNRNPNFWLKDPVGPGKGNQLPYIDSVKFLIIPDASTRLAALRTAQIDHTDSLNQADTDPMKKGTPALITADAGTTGIGKMFIRTDKAPFTDVRVRRAMMMATDRQTILKNVFGGRGLIQTFPFAYQQEYAGLYLDLDAPDTPASVKELYVYNPDKAKQLLKDAGYPNGFKTSVMVLATQVDDISIFKDMWAKVGIDLALDIKEPAVYNSLDRSRGYEALTTSGGQGPISIFYIGSSISGQGGSNGSMINDPVINDGLAKIRRTALTDLNEAMKQMRELTKYILDQAYAMPAIQGYTTRFWWPWLKNYSAEGSVGYFSQWNWTQWVWLDQDLKKKMGY